MLFVIHAIDGANGPLGRSRAQPAHSEHLKRAGAYGVSLVMSGPLVEDDGATMKGSLLVVEAADRTAVERFNKEDPYMDEGVWQTVTITAFLRKT